MERLPGICEIYDLMMFYVYVLFSAMSILLKGVSDEKKVKNHCSGHKMPALRSYIRK